MDSNFQVTISANIADLQRSIKDAQATLAQFKQSADGVAAATKNMEQSANRGRLVAFAFGQVIRDAGFFAQDFRLGILAISNNIPILIDQLVLLSGASAAVGGAISLLGSLLTAGLTIWAYSASGVDSVTKSLKEYQSSINEARAGAQGEIETLNALLSVAKNQSLSIQQRQDAINRLNNEYKVYNNELTINNVNSEKNRELTDRLTSSLLFQAQASAEAAHFTKLQSQMYDIQDKKLEDQLSIFDKYQVYMRSIIKTMPQFAAGMAGMDPTQLGIAYGKFLAQTQRGFSIRGMENYADAFTKLSPEIDASKSRLEGFIEALTKQGVETAKTGTKKETYISIMTKLRAELQNVDYALTGTFGEKQESRVKAMQSALESLRKIGFGQTTKAAKDLSSEIESILGQQQALDSKQTPIRVARVTNTMGGAPRAPETLSADQINKATEAYAKQTSIWNILFGAIKRAKDEQEQFNQSMTRVAEGGIRLIGGELTNAFQVMIETGELSFQSITKALGQMIKRLLAATLAAALLSTIVSSLGLGIGAASKGNFIGNAAEIMRLMGGAMFANGGIVSGPTLGMVGEYPGARSNPEVIAPLDKLKSILGGAGEGQIGAVIAETKISGNDLSILIKRADNNRNEYF